MTDQQSIIATTIVQTAKGALDLSFEAGRPIVVLGKNGAGKSALVHHLAGRMQNHAVYIPGSRPSYFNNESLSLTAATRRDLANSLRSWDSSPDTRWRSLEGTSRNEKAIHDLQAAEVQSAVTATEDIKREGVNSPAIGKLISSISPVDRVNALLHQAGLAVQVLMKSGELQCQRNGSVYSIANVGWRKNCSSHSGGSCRCRAGLDIHH